MLTYAVTPTAAAALRSAISVADVELVIRARREVLSLLALLGERYSVYWLY
jgi:hypothetical protein